MIPFRNHPTTRMVPIWNHCCNSYCIQYDSPKGPRKTLFRQLATIAYTYATHKQHRLRATQVSSSPMATKQLDIFFVLFVMFLSRKSLMLEKFFFPSFLSFASLNSRFRSAKQTFFPASASFFMLHNRQHFTFYRDPRSLGGEYCGGTPCTPQITHTHYI